MVDQTSAEADSFAAMFRPQTEGQRSNHDLYQRGSVSSLSQFDVSSHLPCEASDDAGSMMNGTEHSGNASYWGNMSPVSSMVLNRNKAPGMYDTFWSSHCQQGATESYDTTGHQQQKLDSFSEAFCSRSTSRIPQNGFSTPSSNSMPPSNLLSFPLVLSPPPTPLPPASFSPPKRTQHCAAGQIPNQSQMQMQTDGPVQLFSSLSSPSTSRFNPSIWIQLPTEDTEGMDLTQSLPHDSVYSEHGGPHLKQILPPQKSTDCSLQLSINPVLAQHLPQSCVQLDHEPGTSHDMEDHMTWPQVAQSPLALGPSQQLNVSTQGSGSADGSRFSCGLSFSSGSSDKPLVSSSSQGVSIVTYTGVPFNSVIQLGRELMETWEGAVSHYTPAPMLNPTRSGTGLFYNLLPPLALENRALWTDDRKENDSHRYINIGPDFQAELPDLITGEHEMWSEEPVREELLWKPWAELEESDTILQQVENLLDLSASSVLPGGGANLELALHSLSRCEGNILEALEMLLFSIFTPSEDYHYSGTDSWTLSEQRLFHKAFMIYGKDFSFIHKMVRTKQVSQCVEFYYNSKRLSEKQRKLRETERERLEVERNAVNINQVPQVPKMVNQTSIERLIHTPPLPTSFPCKQCGKMFYKIKSRNAHMKIHRQQQDDWREKLQLHPNLNPTRSLPHPNQQILTQTHHHQNHILTQSLIQNLVQSQTQLAFLQSTKTELIPKQQYQLYGSHPKSTDQSPSLPSPHWTSADTGLPAECRDRWPVL